MMMLLSTISEAVLYACFALLMGSFILSLIPGDLKPLIVVSKKVKLIAVVGIALFSFMPVFTLMTYLIDEYSFLYVLETVLLTFEIGKAWVVTFVITTFLAIFIFLLDDRNSPAYPILGIGLLLAMVAAMSWTTHSHAVYGLQGFITHFVHFSTVIIWIGVLTMVAWFSNNKDNWIAFLSWFHTMAIFCFAIIFVTGLTLVSYSMNMTEYPNSWMQPYGQSLLIKHLLILPLIGYAFINGFLMQRKIRAKEEMDPRSWTKLEYIIVLFIFAATGAMSQQEPPHNGASFSKETLLQSFGILPSSEGSLAPISVELAFHYQGILLGALAAAFLAISIYSFIKRMPPIFSFVMSFCLVLCALMAVSMSIVVY
ncbi:MAG: CopD family protein [Psychrobacillus sp.]